MDIYIRDRDTFERKVLIDEFQSFIWTDRYDKPGDFELIATLTPDWATKYRIDDFVEYSGSNTLASIESSIVESADGGAKKVTLKGRTLEALLERRVIWGYRNFAKRRVGDVLNTIIRENASAPQDNNRRIPGLVVGDFDVAPISYNSFGNPTYMSADFFGENLLTVVTDYLGQSQSGIESVYSGANTFTVRPIVKSRWITGVFSPEYDTLHNVRTSTDTVGTHSRAIVSFEGSKDKRQWIPVYHNSPGMGPLDIYEVHYDIPAKLEDFPDNEQRYWYLVGAARNELARHAKEVLVDGEVLLRETGLQYGVDFKVGDTAVVFDDFGNRSESRITEYVQSYSDAGHKAYPTFEKMRGTIS